MSKIILISDKSDLDKIPKIQFEETSTIIYSFELEVHEYLKSKNIEHEIADDLFQHEERLELFYHMLDFRHWHSKISSKDIEFEGVNLLKLFDTHEFHSYLMPILINFVLIKKIVEIVKPSKIIATSIFEKIVECVVNSKNIETEFFENNIDKKLLWDKITIKYNFGKIPVSFNLSKNRYLKFKKTVESIAGLFYDFWLNNDTKNKSIVLLEFNPENFSNLLDHLKDYQGNIILVNRRRSAIWSKKALNVIKKSRCKVVNFEDILDKQQEEELPLLIEEYLSKFERFWDETEFFENLFRIGDLSFWNIIKEDMKNNYQEKIPNFIQLIMSVKNIFHFQDIRCVVSLNEVGETEKAFLEFNKNKISSILLEHGFIDRVKETKRFDEIDCVHFKDKFAVWETYRKKWLCDEFDIDPSRIIISGSPRHDDYFKARTKNVNTKEKTILLAPNPIGDISGLSSTELKLRVNKIIKQIISIVEKFENFKIIVKLHPIQLRHNEELKSFLKQIDKNLPVFLTTSVIDTINNSDIVIVLSPEIYGISTMILESMILGKPTMNIVFSKDIYQFNYVKKNAVCTISDTSDIEKKIHKMLYDQKFQNDLIKNADEFIGEFMANPGNASEKFSKILKSY